MQELKLACVYDIGLSCGERAQASCYDGETKEGRSICEVKDLKMSATGSIRIWHPGPILGCILYLGCCVLCI
jgi:hypothetical protein